MKKVTILEHNRYTIRAMQIGKIVAARATLRDAQRHTGYLAQADAPDEATAIADVMEQLDARDAAHRGERRTATNGVEVPGPADYADAMAAMPPNKAQEAMLLAHAKAGDEGLTAGELARSAGYKSYEVANSMYGKLGRVWAEYLDVKGLPTRPDNGAEFFTSCLAKGGPPRASGEHVWVMHTELREALGQD